jgi:predicted nucleic acid-binding protein
LEVQADYLLIDERKGSQRALELGVPTIGLLRVILELKLRRIIPEVKTVLDEMRETGGFWMGEALYQRVLEAAGE